MRITGRRHSNRRALWHELNHSWPSARLHCRSPKSDSATWPIGMVPRCCRDRDEAHGGHG